jgi:hypothetical protein
MATMQHADAGTLERGAFFDRITAFNMAASFDHRHSGELFRYLSCEARVPESHSLRAIRAIVDEVLEVLSLQLPEICVNPLDPTSGFV